MEGEVWEGLSRNDPAICMATAQNTKTKIAFNEQEARNESDLTKTTNHFHACFALIISVTIK